MDSLRNLARFASSKPYALIAWIPWKVSWTRVKSSALARRAALTPRAQPRRHDDRQDHDHDARAKHQQGEVRAEQACDGNLQRHHRNRDHRLDDHVVHHRRDHGAVLEHPVDAIARGRPRMEPQAQILGVAHHGDAKILVDALQDPDLVHREQRERAGCGHDDHRRDDEEPEQHFEPRGLAQRLDTHVPSLRQQHHRRLHPGKRLRTTDGVHQDIEAKKADRSTEAEQQQVQRKERKEMPDLGEDVRPRRNVDATEPLQVEPQRVELRVRGPPDPHRALYAAGMQTGTFGYRHGAPPFKRYADVLVRKCSLARGRNADEDVRAPFPDLRRTASLACAQQRKVRKFATQAVHLRWPQVGARTSPSAFLSGTRAAGEEAVIRWRNAAG